MKYIIYKAENKITGKYYIGQTSNSLKKRINHHIYRANNSGYYFHNAIKKYSKEKFNGIMSLKKQGEKGV